MKRYFAIWRVVENNGEVKSYYKNYAYSNWLGINEAHRKAELWTKEDKDVGHIYAVREMK